MGAAEHLSSHGVTVEVANAFIMGNLDNLELIYTTCQQFGVNNDMIAEILASNFSGLTGAVVSSFFDASGFNGNALGFDSTVIAPSATGTLDLGNLFSYGQIQLWQNVSQEFVDTMPEVLSFLQGNYAYASSDTWDSIQDLGFTDNYSVLDSGAEAAYTNDYTTTAVGYDVALGQSGGFSASVGSYDMIIGL